MVDRQLLILSRTSLKKLCTSREKARALSKRGSDMFAGIGGRSGQLAAEGSGVVAQLLRLRASALKVPTSASRCVERVHEFRIVTSPLVCPGHGLGLLKLCQVPLGRNAPDVVAARSAHRDEGESGDRLDVHSGAGSGMLLKKGTRQTICTTAHSAR